MRLEKLISALMRYLLHLRESGMAFLSSELKAAQPEDIKELVRRTVRQAFLFLAEAGRPFAQQAATIVREAATAPPKRSFAAHSYLGPDCSVNGTLHFEGAARIDGHVDGEINAKDIIVIGKSAVVTAKINAGLVILAGIVSGEITASQRIEIRPSAEMQGSVKAPKLIIDDGASITGHCAMQSQETALEQQGQRAYSVPSTFLGEMLGFNACLEESLTTDIAA
jgi:cytoskeletal protein CcmA (bactofilin family)